MFCDSRPKSSAGPETAELTGFFLLEGIAGTPVFYKGMRMIGAGSPVTVYIDECFFRDKEAAIAAFELFVFHFVVAGIPE